MYTNTRSIEIEQRLRFRHWPSKLVYKTCTHKRRRSYPILERLVDVWSWWRKAGVGNLRPAWTFDLVRIRFFLTRVRAQHGVKTRLDDK